MDFKVSTAATQGFVGLLVSVEGKLDIANVERVEVPCEAAARIPCPLILDLSHCSFIDSGGLRTVLGVRRAVTEVGEAMAIVTAQHQVRKLLAMGSVDGSLQVFPTRKEAIRWLAAKGRRRRMRRSLPSLPRERGTVATASPDQ